MDAAAASSHTTHHGKRKRVSFHENKTDYDKENELKNINDTIDKENELKNTIDTIDKENAERQSEEEEEDASEEEDDSDEERIEIDPEMAARINEMTEEEFERFANENGFGAEEGVAKAIAAYAAAAGGGAQFEESDENSEEDDQDDTDGKESEEDENDENKSGTNSEISDDEEQATDVNFAQLMSCMEAEGPRIDTLMLHADGKIEQCKDIDMTPKKDAVTRLLGGQGAIVGAIPQLGVVVLARRERQKSAPKNQHKLPIDPKLLEISSEDESENDESENDESTDNNDAAAYNAAKTARAAERARLNVSLKDIAGSLLLIRMDRNSVPQSLTLAEYEECKRNYDNGNLVVDTAVQNKSRDAQTI